MGQNGLNPIVQRMIDAGESEENIATVIQHFKSQTVPTPTTAQLLSKNNPPLSDGPPGFLAEVNQALQPLAHPTTVGDMASLAIPGQLAGAIRTAGMYGRALMQGAKGRPAGLFGTLQIPARAYQSLKAGFPSEMRKAVEAFRGPKQPPMPARPITVTSGSDVFERLRNQAMPEADALRKAGMSEAAIQRMQTGRQPTGGGYIRTAGTSQAAPTAAPAQTAMEAAVAPAPTSQPLGRPRIMSVKQTPTSWTPEAARARLEINDWHSGAEPGSLEAAQAASQHKYAGEMDSRLKFLLQNPNAAYGPLVIGASIPMLRDELLRRMDIK